MLMIGTLQQARRLACVCVVEGEKKGGVSA